MKNKGMLVLFLVLLLVGLSACGKKDAPEEIKEEADLIIVISPQSSRQGKYLK